MSAPTTPRSDPVDVEALPGAPGPVTMHMQAEPVGGLILAGLHWDAR